MKSVSTSFFITALTCFFLIPVTGISQILDPTFGINGKQVKTAVNDDLSIVSALLEKDSSIVVSAFSDQDLYFGNDILIWHYSKDGFIDSSFGKHGTVDIVNHGGAIKLQPDGKIVGTGTESAGGDSGNPDSLLLFRLNTNGQFDSTFGKNGIAHFTFGGEFEKGSNLDIKADGKILITGSMYTADTAASIAQFLPDGSLDYSFGNNGLIDVENAANIKAFGNGKFIAAQVQALASGLNFSKFVRYNADGKKDISFGTNGVFTIDTAMTSTPSFGFVSLSDSSVIAATTGNNFNVLLFKFKSNGDIDSSFGNNGVDSTKLMEVVQYSNENLMPAIQPDGKYIFAKRTPDFSLTRLNVNGTIDSSFGVKGILSTDFLNFDPQATGVFNYPLMQGDNKILAVGSTYPTLTNSKLAMARFVLQDALPISITSFTATKENTSVLLNWQTVNELNNDYFSVERSNDGINFSAIGNVKSKGNAAQKQSYAFVDATPFSGKNFYRLNEVDKNGKSNYSNIVNADFTLVSLIKIYPNPAMDVLNISGLKNSSTSISIIDAQGKTIVQKIVSSENYQMNIASLHAGNYFIKIENDNKITTIKFIKE